MEFRTEINLESSNNNVSYSDNILTIGSCFADNIAAKLKDLKFNICQNPFGVLYNPASIYNSLNLIQEKKLFDKTDLFEDQSEYHSFYHHSSFSGINEISTLNKINLGLEKTSLFLKSVSFVTITLGTAWVYENKSTGKIVSNCHKIPAKEFNRYRLTVDQISEYLIKTKELLRSYNPDVRILFTVSPIRHWKDGAVENMISKSSLLLAVNNVLDETTEYFPSYEIVMDDLRDYRFYDKDMLHPNNLAIEYIWEKFTGVFFSDETKKKIQIVTKIRNAFNHRPRNPNSEKHQKFLNSNIDLIHKITEENPEINLKEELDYFTKLLI